jgi:hypothetical protein
MLKGPRFIWFNWSQAITASLTENETHYIFEGAVSCYTHLDKKIVHRRKILKSKEKHEWIIVDTIDNKPDTIEMRQLWHTTSNNLNFKCEGIEVQSKEAWQSLYYGVKKKTIQREFVTNDNHIETKIFI